MLLIHTLLKTPKSLIEMLKLRGEAGLILIYAILHRVEMRMEELYNSNLKWKKVAGDGATIRNQVRDPNIVKTKGNTGKVATNFQKGR